jgi:hypothetical protein
VADPAERAALLAEGKEMRAMREIG